MADPWVRFFTSDWLAGTSGQSAAERGVYITLLCLIYENDGPIRRDDDRMARRCGMTKAAFIKAVTCLIEEGKITETGVMISNVRAEIEIEARAIRSNSARASANQRWDAQKEKEQQNQPVSDANASAKQCETDANQNQNHNHNHTLDAGASKGRARKRATHLPDDWVIPSDWSEWALSEGWSESAVRIEADKFRDYWCAVAGQRGTKLNWQATWRNWMRRNPPATVLNGGQYAKSSRSAKRAAAFLSGARL